MRELFFDESFDGVIFSGRHGVATAGESRVGPLGLFESLLGAHAQGERRSAKQGPVELTVVLRRVTRRAV